MLRQLLRSCLVLSASLIIVSGDAPPVGAGGWAVTTLDTLRAPTVGTSTEVGFTVLQHGVTPARLDADVAIEVHAPSGRIDVFPARAEGVVGHYMADVTFHETGESRWSVRQGWFGEQDLGAITVTADPTSAPRVRHAWPAATRVVLSLLAILLAAFAILDRRRSRRAPGAA